MQVELERNELERVQLEFVSAAGRAIQRNATRSRAHNEQTCAWLSRLAE